MTFKAETLLRSRTIGIALVILAALVHCLVAVHTPYSLLADASGDDGLFIKQARLILSGDYLGPYTWATLIKGPGYALFLALTYLSGLPVSFTQAAFFLVAAGAFAWVVARLFRANLLGVCLFILLALHPALPVDRFLREAIYPGQVLLVVALFVTAFLILPRPSIFWGALAGLALAWYWLTREEGMWLVPALLLLIAGAFARSWPQRQTLRAAATAGTMLIFFAGAHAAFYTANWVHYGYFAGLDIKERNFTRALSIVQSVRDGQQIPYVPVSKSTRAILYEVSPTFASLREGLDPSDRTIPDHGCRFYPQTCGDMAGGWFIWHFRDAASRAGAFKSPQAASEFFGRLVGELEAACSSGRLTCRGGIVPFMPAIQPEQMRTILPKLWAVTQFVLKSPFQTSRRSTGTRQLRESALALLNYPLISPPKSEKKQVMLSLWWTPAASGMPTVSVVRADGSMTTQLLEPPETPRSPGSVAQQNFVLTAACDSTCNLRIGVGADAKQILLSDTLGKSVPITTIGGVLRINGQMIEDHLTAAATAKADWVRSSLLKLYVPMAYVLAPAGLLSIIVCSVLVMRRPSYLTTYLFAAALWALVMCRIALITAVEVSSFPAMNIHYLGVAVILLLPASLCSIALLVGMLRQRQVYPV